MLGHSMIKTISISMLVCLLIPLKCQFAFSENVMPQITPKAVQTNNVNKSQANLIINIAKDLISSHKILDYNYVQTYLCKHLKDNHSIIDIYLGYGNNKFITGTGWYPPFDYKCTKRDWYKNAIKARGVVFSPISVDITANKKVRSVSYPIIVNKKIIGVISTDFYM
jgi:hypothetical protein